MDEKMDEMMDYAARKGELIDQVLNQIVKDVNIGDLTAIEELIAFIPDDRLIAFLSEVE